MEGESSMRTLEIAGLPCVIGTVSAQIHKVIGLSGLFTKRLDGMGIFRKQKDLNLLVVGHSGDAVAVAETDDNTFKKV